MWAYTVYYAPPPPRTCMHTCALACYSLLSLKLRGQTRFDRDFLVVIMKCSIDTCSYEAHWRRNAPNLTPRTSEGRHKHSRSRNRIKERLLLSRHTGRLQVTNQTRKSKPQNIYMEVKQQPHNSSLLISPQTPAMSAVTYPLITAVAILL